VATRYNIIIRPGSRSSRYLGRCLFTPVPWYLISNRSEGEDGKEWVLSKLVSLSSCVFPKPFRIAPHYMS
jgi:hypothetical protein